MFFHYTAKSAQGATTAGVLEADTLAVARLQLRERGLFPLALRPASGGATAAAGGASRPLWNRRVGKTDLLMLTAQLSIMCRTGMDLAEALQTAASQCRQPALKECLDAIYRDVADGKSVSAALRKQASVFGEAYVTSIAAGEASGRVTEVLGRLADLLRNEIRLRTGLRSVLAYPIALVGVSTIVMSAVIFFVLPQFAKVFEEMQIPAPALTQILISLSEELRARSWLWGGLLAGGGALALRLRTNPRVRRWWDGVLLNSVVLRDITRSLFVGRSFRLLGTMLESGVPLLDAIRLCRDSVRNLLARALFDDLEESIVNGRGMGPAITACRFVPVGAVQMILTGEKTGKLGSVLQSVGEFYEDEGERRLRDLTKLLEPAIIVSLGVVVAVIVASVMLPLLDFSNVH